MGNAHLLTHMLSKKELLSFAAFFQSLTFPRTFYHVVSKCFSFDYKFYLKTSAKIAVTRASTTKKLDGLSVAIATLQLNEIATYLQEADVN